MLTLKSPHHRPREVVPPTTISLGRLQLILMLVVWVTLLLCYFWPEVHNVPSSSSSHSMKDGTHSVRNGTQHHDDYLDSSHYPELMAWQGNEHELINMSWTGSNDTGQEQDVILHRRVKRGVLDLASMIKCVTGCNPFMYKDYGCYCGFQGDGYPVDGIDRCCFMHDNCYSRADCHQALVYFKSYKWACMGYGRAKCGYMSSSLCALHLCECDRKFAKCLTRYRCPHSKASCDISKNLIIGK